MKLVSYDGDRVGRVENGHLADLTDLANEGVRSESISRMRQLIARWPALREQASRPAAESRPLREVRLDPPIPDPTKILAAPVNYVDHQREMQVDSNVDALGMFLKSPASLLGPGGTVVLPYFDRRFDQEGELAAVIGSVAERVPVESALNHVFGYTALLDITMRGGEDRSTRKSFKTFTPLGPWIVTADEFGDPNDADLVCVVSGTERQRANTRDLIWSVARLVSYSSWISPLLPGDIVSTGTPAGVGRIQDGDSISVMISRIGTLSVDVSASRAIASHTSGRGSVPVVGSATASDRSS